ncbi:hypothetical protein AKJ57_00815 [candidate division MSBL1 archaeon SCGC-AAA259A05]|uniref:Pyrrolo-quinoline quinone repeat domain-containing protein n=1 Tax=candidate division MSBL1 archaeon SCGC-AAA259A05 TaxID=1698259 RepID=A0A133UBF9_9EURY|nr:hypothetical protein AKJ57_00815 [candidate division MSBL1 archaeon SCGC-AAA259A05]
MERLRRQIPSEKKLLWEKKVVGTFDEFAGIVADNGIVYTVGKTMNNAPVTATDAATGDVIWQTPVGSCDSTPVISGNKIFVINCMWDDYKVKNVEKPVSNERVWCLNKNDGSIIWTDDKVLPEGVAGFSF